MFLNFYQFYKLLPVVLLLGCNGETRNSKEIFWPMHIIDDTSFGADGTKIGDVNNDGYEDIICGWEQGGVARLYINPTDGNKWSYIEVPAPSVEDAMLLDLNGDGLQDIVTFSEGKHQRITFHWAPEQSNYFNSEQWVSEDVPATVDVTQWMFGRAMNVDQKNGIDLIVGSKNEGGMLGWLESPNNPEEVSTWKLHTIAKAGWIMSIETVDIDGDGLKDILISDRYGECNGVKWYKNPGSAEGQLHSAWEERLIGMRGQEPMFLEAVSLSKDGFWDIWVPDRKGKLLNFRQLDKTGQEWATKSFSYPPPSYLLGKSVALGDINGDQESDLVMSYANAENTTGVFWASFSQDTLIYHAVSGPAGIKYDLIELIDMDKDGDLDILTSEENNNSSSDAGLGVIWYENRVANR